jgi:hypothetical protein
MPKNSGQAFQTATEMSLSVNGCGMVGAMRNNLSQWPLARRRLIIRRRVFFFLSLVRVDVAALTCVILIPQIPLLSRDEERANLTGQRGALLERQIRR